MNASYTPGALGNPIDALSGPIYPSLRANEEVYFPGKDYPDREVWLKIRAAQGDGYAKASRLVYNPTPKDGQGRLLKSKPYFIGNNAAKKGARLAEDPRKAHQTLVRLRHAAYRRAGNETQNSKAT